MSQENWERLMVQYMRRNAERQANMFVVAASTPAQLFHALRRQMNRPFLKCAQLPRRVDTSFISEVRNMQQQRPCHTPSVSRSGQVWACASFVLHSLFDMRVKAAGAADAQVPAPSPPGHICAA